MRKQRETNQGLIENGIDLLARLTNWTVLRQPDRKKDVDWAARVVARDGKNKWGIGIVAVTQLDVATLPKAVQSLKGARKTHPKITPLLFAPRLTRKQAEVLRDEHLSYLDLRGNLNLELPGQRLWFVDAASEGAKRGPARALNPRNISLSAAGGRLLYTILTQPERVNASYHELARLTRVSTATVKHTLDWLIHRDLVRVRGTSKKSDRISANPERWLDLWVEVYNDRLRSKLKLGSYGNRFERDELEPVSSTPKSDAIILDVSMNESGWVWGGQKAAENLLPHLFQGQFDCIVYLRNRSELNRFIAKNGLVRDAEGKVEILLAFWPEEDELQSPDGPYESAAPPLIVYAELLRMSNSRCWEAAEAIKEKYLKKSLNYA